VRWNFQRDSASHAADAVEGVKQVRNLIEVMPLSPDAYRKTERKRPDTTPKSIHRSEVPSPAADARPMFFVPNSVGRG